MPCKPTFCAILTNFESSAPDTDKDQLKLWFTELESSTLISETISGNWNSFRTDEKCFLFHFKCSFISEDI